MVEDSRQDEVRALARAIRGMVEDRRAEGWDEIPARPGIVSAHAAGTEAAPAPAFAPERVDSGGPGSLEEVREELGDCQRCKLCETRTQIVFGTGNPNADVVFVGEGPGEEEDRRGEPFVGRAGQLLTSIITRGMGIAREDVYIANVVKCRPPGNRNPEPDEIFACEPFLVAQVEAIRPRVIVALGKFAAQTLLRTKTPISKLRGQWQDYRGIRLMPTFHPSYLLRNPADKKLVWEDIQQVMSAVGLPKPKDRAQG